MVPHHTCDPATFPRARSWGPAQVSAAPGHCWGCGTAGSGHGVGLESPLHLQTPAGLVSPHPGDSMAVIALVTPSPCMGHYAGCALPSEPCKQVTQRRDRPRGLG